MSFIYTWENETKTILKRTNEKGEESYVPVDGENLNYGEFLSSGAVASSYVAPAEPPLSADEKLAQSGLTVNEIKKLLGLS